MDKFAKQEYYDKIIAGATSTGARLLSQVQTSTDNFPYHVTVTSARCTTLVFDLPGKALFLILSHNEHDGFLDYAYQNHWSARIDCEYVSYEKFASMHLGTFDDPFDDFVTERLTRFDKVTGLNHCGWSRCHNQMRTYNGDIKNPRPMDVTVSEDVVIAVAREVLDYQANHDYLTDKFDELSPMWEPHYSFKVMKEGLTVDYLAKELTNHFWLKFAENSKHPKVNKILSDKIKRIW